jgi:hypothetical protein
VIITIDEVPKIDRKILSPSELWSHLIVKVTKSLKVASELRALGILSGLNFKSLDTRKVSKGS